MIIAFLYMLAKLFVNYYSVCLYGKSSIVAGICGSHVKLSDFSRALLPEMFPSREALGRVYFTGTESTRSVLAS